MTNNSHRSDNPKYRPFMTGSGLWQIYELTAMLDGGVAQYKRLPEHNTDKAVTWFKTEEAAKEYIKELEAQP